MAADGRPLVRVDGLEKYFFEGNTIIDRLLGESPTAVRAVDDVGFEVHRGETLGLVGESGCGKSTVGETILRLQEPTGGDVEYDGVSVYDMDAAALRSFRRNTQIVFQDPFSSLDPRMTVGDIVAEPLRVHDIGSPEDRESRARTLLERVGLSADQLDRYPHEFSGGQRQRIAIARALALEPDFVVLDEPTSALDVSVQAQILNLLEDLQDEFDLTYLLISHDLSVIRHICDRVAVMYLGELVEIGPSEAIFAEPRHPYTKALLASVPRASTDERHRQRRTISGDVPSPRNPPSGCRFRTRCPAVIPPDAVDLDQETYRAIMDFRGRIEDREISLEPLGDERFEVADHGVPEDDRDAFVSAIVARFFETAPPGRHGEAITAAVEALAERDWSGAADRLAAEYESVCERVNPTLGGDAGHPVACHLHNEPADRVGMPEPSP